MPATVTDERVQEADSPLEFAAGVSPAETTLVELVATILGGVWATAVVSGE